LQLGGAVLRAAPMRRFCELCQTRPLPAAPRPFRALPVEAGPFGGVDPPEHCAASWSYSSNHNPLGNCIGARPETGPGPDSTRTRFLMSRLVAQLLCRITGSAATPSRGTGDICLSQLAPRRGERHQLSPSFPRLPGIIPIALSAGFSCRRAATVLSRNREKMRRAGPKERVSSSHLIHPARAINLPAPR
jgi:hypothetical protein